MDKTTCICGIIIWQNPSKYNILNHNLYIIIHAIYPSILRFLRLFAFIWNIFLKFISSNATIDENAFDLVFACFLKLNSFNLQLVLCRWVTNIIPHLHITSAGKMEICCLLDHLENGHICKTLNIVILHLLNALFHKLYYAKLCGKAKCR